MLAVATHAFIEAGDALLNRLKSENVDYEGFESDVLSAHWEMVYPEPPSSEAARELEDAIKLLWLLSLRERLVEGAFVADFLRVLPVEVGSFDRYWTLRIFFAPDEHIADVWSRVAESVATTSPDLCRRLQKALALSLRGSGRVVEPPASSRPDE